MAQSTTMSDSRVIVRFGAGRLQKWREMNLSSYSYILVDPAIDMSTVKRSMKRIQVGDYDFSRKFLPQAIRLGKMPRCILITKCRSEDFLLKAMPRPRRSEHPQPDGRQRPHNDDAQER